MSRILYYLLLKPLSYLPLGVLYYVSDFLYLILYRLVGYRKKVVFENLRNAYPDKTPAEIQILGSKFYRHFCDVIVESVRFFSIPRKQVIERFKLVNPEILDQFHQEGRNIMITAGHYNNWELAVIAFDTQSQYNGVTIYAPLANKFLDQKLKASRSQFGLRMISKKESRNFFQNEFPDGENSALCAVIFGSDQSPSSSKKAHWTNFLNQDTAVAFGAEKYAKMTNSPVIFAHIDKIKRGYYQARFEVVEADPVNAAPGSITEKHTRLLEEEINAAPQYWLWTHKRWKRKRSEIDQA